MTLPWAQHYDPGVPLTVEPVTTSVPWLLLDAAAKTPQAPALVFFGRSFTYRQLSDQAARLAQAFQGQGLAPGERLAILLPNCPQFVVAYHAALRLGAVVVPLNPLLSAKELAQQLSNSGARRLVVLDHLLPKVEAFPGLTHLMVTSLTDVLPWPLSWLYPLQARRQGLALGFRAAAGRFAWRTLLAQPPLAAAPRPGVEDLAVLLYTGGTTGTPKAARLTHGNLMANVAQVNAWLPQRALRRRAAGGSAALCPLLRSHRLPQLAHVPRGADHRPAPLRAGRLHQDVAEIPAHHAARSAHPLCGPD